MNTIKPLLMTSALLVSLIGCLTDDDLAIHRDQNVQLTQNVHTNQVNSAIITQSTIFPHHFITHTPTLNPLGKKNLDVLAHHYINDVMPVSSPVKIVSDVRVYFDYNKSNLRSEAKPVLDAAIEALKNNPNADILITGRTDIRGADDYNMKLGNRRADAVDAYMAANGVPADRIRILSRGEMDSLAPETNEEGMQEDRNAHFVVADVQHYPIPLNVRQAGVSDNLYQARKKNTLSYLAEKGVDTDLIRIADDFAGGEGLASEQVYVIVTYTAEGSDDSSSDSFSTTDSGR